MRVATGPRAMGVAADDTRGIGVGDDTAYLRALIAAAVADRADTLVIYDGTWMIDAVTGTGATRGLVIPSGLHLVIRSDATLRAIPTGSPHYSVVTVANARHVYITGEGSILGERYAHAGTAGQWGMGINVLASTDVTIEGLTISDCWGDSIYVGHNFGVSGDVPTGIVIDDCTLSGSRRQGVSVTVADGVKITDCTIGGIHGHPPQYGIDLETNNPDRPVRNVTIERTGFRGSTGGAIVVGTPAEIVRIRDCQFDGDRVSLNHATDVRVTDCTFTGTSMEVRASHDVRTTGGTFTDSSYVASRHTGPSSDLAVADSVFTNPSGDPDRRAISVTGESHPLDGFKVTGNTVRGYTDRSIITTDGVTGLRITDNDVISDVPVHAPMAQLRANDGIINGNNFDAAGGPDGGGLVRINLPRGLVAANTFRAGTNRSGLLRLNNVPGAATGATVTANRFDAPVGDAIRVTGETEYSVYGNDEHIGVP